MHLIPNPNPKRTHVQVPLPGHQGQVAQRQQQQHPEGNHHHQVQQQQLQEQEQEQAGAHYHVGSSAAQPYSVQPPPQAQPSHPFPAARVASLPANGRLGWRDVAKGAPVSETRKRSAERRALKLADLAKLKKELLNMEAHICAT